ncbi:hypothetical protein FE257_010379 [Aspergillus nanangensis]|uniref:SGNH hydrolase-type esterase domain-containing protein n=1 Tax=Aspergillus nanangensis TaxID=2582783 RepID=A0AAD4CIU8_ASPNN|nr:hypothetical protein FE257_010379 [Aspergillus nanangensis]
MLKPTNPMANMAWVLVVILLFVNSIGGYVVPSGGNDTFLNQTASIEGTSQDRSHDWRDMGWINRWGAIGDSYTAGIGAGQLWPNSLSVSIPRTSYHCSRYDESWVANLYRAFGPSAKYFEYRACSGARTAEILQQAKDLGNDMDLVVMSAGGNDLCLADIIKRCIFMPMLGGCDQVLVKAEGNIREILKWNVREILKELDSHMAKNSVVILVGYAQFFHLSPDCEKKHDFTWPRTGIISTHLTVDLRARFNSLVNDTNHIFKEIVREIQVANGYKYKIGYADWDEWPQLEEVQGQFCWPDTTGLVPDPTQPNLHFFKSKTAIGRNNELKFINGSLENGPLAVNGSVNASFEDFALTTEKRSGWHESIYKTLVDRTLNPLTDVLERLNIRAPPANRPPKCPSDDRWGLPVQLPDDIGKMFHPTIVGHRTIASSVLYAISVTRYSIHHGGKEPSGQFMCSVTPGTDSHASAWRHYVSPQILDGTYKIYCDQLNTYNTPDWHDSRGFFVGSPEEHTYSHWVTGDNIKLDREKCLESFKKLIYSCDTPHSDNPRNLKHGGVWDRGNLHYSLTPSPRYQRPWPLQGPTGKCQYQDTQFYTMFVIYGAGWATDDWGSSYKNAIDSCLRHYTSPVQLDNWHFEYNPQGDQYEWSAQFALRRYYHHACVREGHAAKMIGGSHGRCEKVSHLVGGIQDPFLIFADNNQTLNNTD